MGKVDPDDIVDDESDEEKSGDFERRQPHDGNERDAESDADDVHQEPMTGENPHDDERRRGQQREKLGQRVHAKRTQVYTNT